MDIGLGIPQIGHFADPSLTCSLARRAEAAGYSSLWALDRLLTPTAPRNPYPASADGSLPAEQRVIMDPIVTLTAAAAVTTTIRVGTNVLVAPWYPPVLLARSLATLDRVSNGRLTVGLGLGWSIDEYDAVGAPMRNLGIRMEEILEVLHMAWNHDVVEIETTRETIKPAAIGLRPLQRPRPPLVLAAYTPAGFERIARRADGWTPVGIPLDVVADIWTSILETAARYGRDTSAMRLVQRANVKITGSELADDRPSFVGSLAQVRSDIERAEAVGCHELILDLQATTETVDEMLDLADQLTARMLAAV